MDHLSGQDQISNPPLRFGKGTSLAVRQFMALVRGEEEPHQPNNPWQVEKVVAEERYCRNCYGVHWFDIVLGRGQDGRRTALYQCRGCGHQMDFYFLRGG